MEYTVSTEHYGEPWYRPKVKVKAFIRYNSTDRKQVVYFRKSGRMFKLIDANNVQLMATRVTFNHWLRNISRDVKTTAVFEDEQVLYNGKPVHIPVDTVEVLEELLDEYVY